MRDFSLVLLHSVLTEKQLRMLRSKSKQVLNRISHVTTNINFSEFLLWVAVEKILPAVCIDGSTRSLTRTLAHSEAYNVESG